jgi:predicted PurR-regulated permease PerM
MPPGMDRVGVFLQEKTPRRAIALLGFVGLIVLFRQLLPLVVLFVAFERALGVSSAWLARRTRWREKYALLAIVAVIVAGVGAATTLSASRVVRGVERARDTLPERIAAARAHPFFHRVSEHLPGTEQIIESAKHYASDALHVLAAVGHFLAYALIAFLLAIIFVLEKKEILHWRSELAGDSLTATLARWFEHLGDAISVTVQLQLVVAAFNTVLTLPLLFLLGIKHKLALMALIFVSGLIPVVGNIVSGTVLSVLAYLAKGWVGVGVFVLLTFALHKIEAYYLNPRLTSRHVALPGFLLVASLLCWEHLLGFAGLFVSFPFLFVAARIRAEIREEAAGAKSAPS